jgi:apolipoprotein N-acyltransferase
MHGLLSWIRESTSFWGRAVIALVGGLLLAFAFPGFNFAPGAFLGVFLLVVAVHKIGVTKALIVGFIAGYAFYGLVLIWLTTYLGPIPWMALCIAEALFFGISLSMMSLVWRWLNGMNFGALKPWLMAASVATIYLGREYFAGHFPYGGLPWARLGLSQVENFTAKWAWAVDISGFSWLIAFVSALAAFFFLHPLPQGSGLAARSRKLLPVALSFGILIGTPFAFQLPVGEETGKLKVAAVQGNANAGLFAINPPGSILGKHLAVAKDLVASGKEKDIELMVWPENSSDLDPLNNTEANLLISEFVTNDLKAPLLFGNKTFRGKDFFNEVDLWLPETGLSDWYDKKRPVPFGEYVPNRDFFMALAPDMVGLIGWDMSPGTRDGIFNVRGEDKVGSLICFEVTIDELHYDLIDQGASALMVQTNSSDFGKSVQGVQLAAISRMRAIETGRTVVSISTVGVSGIYAPDGKVVEELESFEPGAMVSDIALRTDKTPAMVFGRFIEPTAFALTLILTLFAVISSLVKRYKGRR